MQGIAALAYGTDSIPAVDKICGPGGIFVTIAKQRLFGTVGIDGIFGPSETLVVADADADPRLVAADMLAGAEHDELATALLLTNSEKLADEVGAILERGEFDTIPRAEAARTRPRRRGGAIITSTLEESVDLASDFAAEHVCLHLKDAERWIDRVRNAGCIFAGEHSVESVGDYTAGPSHVMPTGGSARLRSPSACTTSSRSPASSSSTPRPSPRSARPASPSDTPKASPPTPAPSNPASRGNPMTNNRMDKALAPKPVGTELQLCQKNAAPDGTPAANSAQPSPPRPRTGEGSG